MKLLVFFTISTVLVSACANPELTRRFKTAEQEQENETLVKVGILSIEAPTENGKPAVADLKGRGQAEFIESISRKSKDNIEFLIALASPFGKARKASLLVDRTLVKRRLILSAELIKRDFAQMAGARIQHLACEISGLSNDAEFKAWDRFSTKYETVDLGKMTLTQDNSGELGATETAPEASGDIIDLTGKLSYSRNLTEEISLRQRYVVLSGTLEPKMIRLLQEGVVGIDLSGNAFVDVVFDLQNTNNELVLDIGPYRDQNGWKSAKTIPLSARQLSLPDSSTDVKGKLECDSTVRKITDEKSRRTIAEGDDNVLFITGKAGPADVILVPKSAIKQRLWYFRDGKDRTLEISYLGANTMLQFDSYEGALAFQNWLRSVGPAAAESEGPMTIGGETLQLGDDKPTEEQIANLTMEVRS